MPWQIAITITLLLSAAFALFYREFTKKHPDAFLETNALMYVFTLSPIGIAAGLYSGQLSFDFPPITWAYMIMGGIIFAIANICAFIGSSKIDAAQFNILGNFRIPITVFLSTILLQEALTTKQFVGVSLLIFASLIIVSTRINRKTLKVDYYTLVALLGAVLFGLGTSAEKFILDSVNFYTYISVGWLFHTIVMVVLASKRTKQIKALIYSKDFKDVMLLGLLRTGAGFCFIYSLNASGNSSLIASVTSYKTALVVIGSYLFLAERDHMRVKVAGTILATVGMLLFV